MSIMHLKNGLFLLLAASGSDRAQGLRRSTGASEAGIRRKSGG